MVYLSLGECCATCHFATPYDESRIECFMHDKIIFDCFVCVDYDINEDLIDDFSGDYYD